MKQKGWRWKAKPFIPWFIRPSSLPKWGIGNTAVSKPTSILSGAHLLTVETDKGKQATMPGGEECSEEKPGQSPGPRRWECYPRWWWGEAFPRMAMTLSSDLNEGGRGNHAPLHGKSIPRKANCNPIHRGGNAANCFFRLGSLGMFLRVWSFLMRFFFHFCFYLDNTHLKYSKCIMDQLHGA